MGFSFKAYEEAAKKRMGEVLLGRHNYVIVDVQRDADSKPLVDWANKNWPFKLNLKIKKTGQRIYAETFHGSNDSKIFWKLITLGAAISGGPKEFAKLRAQLRAEADEKNWTEQQQLLALIKYFIGKGFSACGFDHTYNGKTYRKLAFTGRDSSDNKGLDALITDAEDALDTPNTLVDGGVADKTAQDNVVIDIPTTPNDTLSVNDELNWATDSDNLDSETADPTDFDF